MGLRKGGTRSVILWRIGLPLVSLAYCGVFWLIYVRFLHSHFDYANYNYLDRDALAWVASFFLAVAPVLAAPIATSGVGVLVSFLYVLYYVPAILVLLFSLGRPYEEVLGLQLALTVGMGMLFVAARTAPPVQRVAISKARSNALLWLSLFLIGAIAFTYRDTMRLVSFADVYSVRSAANDLNANPLIGYAILWLSFCLIPFSLVQGWVQREWQHIAVALLACVVIYAANGAKIAALMPIYVYGTYFLTKRRAPFLAALMICISIASILIVTFSPFEGPWLFLPSLVFERTLGSSGNLLVGYYEVFPKYGLTHFTQLNIIQNLFGGYPYGSQSLGQVVSRIYFGARDANFNAGFWSMDGIASFGIPGIYFINFVVAGFCVIFARQSAQFDPAFLGPWISGFASSLVNSSFFTSLTSSGGLLLLALLYFLARPGNVSPKTPSSASPLVEPDGS